MVKGPNDLPMGPAPADAGGSTLSLSLLLRVRAGDQVAQVEVAPSAVAAWFEDGALVRDATYRGPPDAGKSRTVLDPVRQTQDLLRERLRPLFPRTRAVCVSFQGKARGG
jgi:hypothetical protein